MLIFDVARYQALLHLDRSHDRTHLEISWLESSILRNNLLKTVVPVVFDNPISFFF